MAFEISTGEFGHFILLLLYRMQQDGLLDDEIKETLDRLGNLKPVLRAFYHNHSEFLPLLKQMMARLKRPDSALLLHIMSDPSAFDRKAGPIKKVIDANIIYRPRVVEKYLKKRI